MKKEILALLTAILLLSACADYDKKEKPPKTLNLEVEVIHKKDDHYAIHFDNDKQWKAVISDQLDSINWSNAKDIKISDGVYTTPKAYEKRKYFGLISDDKDTIIVSNKHVKLEGANNFRDLGGITTLNGKRLKMGYIYRSDKLSEITETDLDKLDNLEIKNVIDLRTQPEVSEEPDNIPKNAEITYRHLPIGDDSLMGGSEEEMIKKLKKFKPEQSEKFMVNATANFAIDYKDSYKKLYDQLNNDQMPLVFHCTAGKDRTGVATALLLDILGVSKEIIYDDYLMSNYYRYQGNEEMLEEAALYGIDHKILRPFMEVRKKYLDAAYDKIETDYGSVENYFKKGLGFTEKDIAKWKKELLY